MKNITLLNPHQAQAVFVSNGWTEIENYFLKIVGGDHETILANAQISASLAYGDILKIKAGTEYTVDLSAFADAIQLEWTEKSDLGALLYINEKPYLLRVYRETNSDTISVIGDLYPELRIIDFGSGKNEYIQNLQGFVACSELEILNLNNCSSMEDISLLPTFEKLDTLWIDGFSKESQFDYISRCYNLKKLSQNRSSLKSIKHISNLKNLELFAASNNLNLTDISPISGLINLTSLYFIDCEKLSDISPISGLTNLTSLNLRYCEKLFDISPISGLTNLTSLNLISCKNISDISPISGLTKLTSLNLYRCNNLSDISAISGLINLTSLNLSYGENLSDISPISGLINLTSLYLNDCENISDISPISGLINLTLLNLSWCEKLSDISPISGLINLTSLNLHYCKNLSDISPISRLTNLTSLNLSSCKKISDISPISGLINLTSLELSGCENISDISPISGLINLTSLNLSSYDNLSDISPISGLINLTSLNLSSYDNLSDISPISGLINLTSLNLRWCRNLSDISPISGLINLTSLNLDYCKNLSDISPISRLTNLAYLNISDCTRVVLIKPLVNLNNLYKIESRDCPNIRDFHLLSGLKNLNELTWIDPVACSEVLIQCAQNRRDGSYIEEKMDNWINEIQLTKDSNSFISKIVSATQFTTSDFQRATLPIIAQQMRERGVQSEVRNDLDVQTWEKWCHLVIQLTYQDSITCLDKATSDLDIKRETEVIMGPVLLAFSDLVEKYPEEKENIIQKVLKLLQWVDGHSEEERQIAPSAAVFYASIGMREQVLHWLEKATDEKAPLWREKVLFALVRHFAKNENFTEAHRLMDEMSIQEEKDLAIAVIAEHLAINHPVDAGFILDDIKDLRISSKTAKKLLDQPAMFMQSQSLYQLLLYLQETPDELANCLETIISKDNTGKAAETLKNLFVTKLTSAPSASKLLELCNHKAVSEFVKPRALEKFKTYLSDKSVEENEAAIPHFIHELQEHGLVEPGEANELSKLMN